MIGCKTSMLLPALLCLRNGGTSELLHVLVTCVAFFLGNSLHCLWDPCVCVSFRFWKNTEIWDASFRYSVALKNHRTPTGVVLLEQQAEQIDFSHF